LRSPEARRGRINLPVRGEVYRLPVTEATKMLTLALEQLQPDSAQQSGRKRTCDLTHRFAP
jgi:hypothetical protein